MLWVAAGGALGAAARYGVNLAGGRLWGVAFPWHTMLVNVSGSFLMGALVHVMAVKFDVSPEFRAFLTTGVLGGFTTFSAFSMDFAALVQRGDTAWALFYAAATVILSLAAIFIGMAAARLVFP